MVGAFVAYDIIDSVSRYKVIEYYSQHSWHLLLVLLFATVVALISAAFMRLTEPKRDRIKAAVFLLIAVASIWMAHLLLSFAFTKEPALGSAFTAQWMVGIGIGLPIFWLVFGVSFMFRAWGVRSRGMASTPQDKQL
ncbi:MAG: hypothetical protein IPK32_10645 [Verrucomicrobiaceae bacterium]|nr:hypothetical protein [Verrucomicrobiaceae bacterium]